MLRLAASPAFDPTCSREEWGLLALVDGNRSVNEIVALLGRSEFAVAGALAALVERGLLTISTAGSGLADLQRRQDIIAALEARSLSHRPGVSAAQVSSRRLRAGLQSSPSRPEAPPREVPPAA